MYSRAYQVTLYPIPRASHYRNWQWQNALILNENVEQQTVTRQWCIKTNAQKPFLQKFIEQKFATLFRHEADNIWEDSLL